MFSGLFTTIELQSGSTVSAFTHNKDKNSSECPAAGGVRAGPDRLNAAAAIKGLIIIPDFTDTQGVFVPGPDKHSAAQIEREI